MFRGKKTRQELLHEIQELRTRLQETEEALQAIRAGLVDSLVVSGPSGPQVHDRPGINQYYRLLFEQMAEAAVSLNADGTILYGNQRLADMLKQPLENVIGSWFDRFVAAAQQQTWHSLLQQATREIVRSELTLRTADGAPVPVHLSLRSLTADDGPIFCAVITDLSEIAALKQAQAATQQLLHQVEQSEKQARRLATRLRAIARPARQMSALLNLNELIRQMVQSVQEITDCYNVNVFLREGNDLVLAAGYGGYRDSQPPLGYRLTLGQGITGRAAQTGQPLLVPDVQQDKRYLFFEGLPFTRSELAVPIKHGDQILGVIDMQATEPGAFDLADLEALEVLADQLAIALENARLFDEVRQIKEFNENIVQNLLEGIAIEDEGGYFVFVNPAAAEMLGYTVEELTGQHWTALIPVDQQPIVREANERRKRGLADRYELELVRKDGSRLPVLVSGRPRFEGGRFAGTVAIFTDITAHKQAEQTMRRHLAELQTLHRMSVALRFATNLEEILPILIDETLSALAADTGEILLYDTASQRLHPVAARGWFTRFLEDPVPFGEGVAGSVLATGEPHLSDEFAKDPAVRPSARHKIPPGWGGVAAPIRAGEEKIGVLFVSVQLPRQIQTQEVRLLSTLAEMAGAAIHRTRLAEQTQEQARLMQLIMDSVPEGVLLLTADGRILLTNPNAQEHLDALDGGRPGDRLTHLAGRPLAEFLVPAPTASRHELKVPDPPPRIFEVSAQPVERDVQTGSWVLTIRDVTREREERQRLEAQERLAVVGQLAAGIAHDFNNILTVVILHTDLLLRTPNISPEALGRLQTIRQQAGRAAHLVQQILDFSRRAMLQRQPLDLIPFLKEQTKLLKRMLPENIKINLWTGPGECSVNADPTRIQQVVMNLAVNARDAMPLGGELSIRLERVQVQSRAETPLPEMPAGEWVHLQVADTGTGIPSEVLPHIFEPFFTTKEPGQGTGLGLAQVWGIVQQHEGFIGLNTEVGKGTTFDIYLPALPEAGAAVLADSTASPQGNRELILIVEDDPLIRETLAETLELLNYSIMTATNGREALALLAEHSDIALVLSDGIMPDMGGVALFRAMRQEGHMVPMVILTGYPMEEELDKLHRHGLKGWLPKPPDPEELSRIVARALAEG
ncbi:MAG: PAS domain S-box protein [Anaerolineae bacterium]